MPGRLIPIVALVFGLFAVPLDAATPNDLLLLMLSDRDPARSVKAVGVDTVEVSSPDGEAVRIEFDPATGLPLRQIYAIASADGGRITRTETFSDWREVDGLRFPFKAVQLEDGSKLLELTVSDYLVNTGLTSADLSKR